SAQEPQPPGQSPGGESVGQHGSDRYGTREGLTRIAITSTGPLGIFSHRHYDSRRCAPNTQALVTIMHVTIQYCVV
ncbi:MAG TPA: hypothetical protein VGQ24_03205, partial [Gemmatimonadales bacterium]|nr:hypothetical protein [Gemmatimonadales bacterium]